jgi:uncharacterized membrane protein YqhA
VTEERPVPPVQRRFERLLAASRLLALIPVVFLLLDAAGSFVYGTDILLRTVGGDIREPAHIGGRLGVFLVVMDTFLVGATLMIAAFGFYELFVVKNDRESTRYWLPGWLRVHDLEDLKARVVSMLILVAAITFVDRVVESTDEPGLLYLGTGIAVIIVALTAFLRFGQHRSGPGPPAAVAAGAAGALAAGDQVPAAATGDWPSRAQTKTTAAAAAGTAGQHRERVVALLGTTRRDDGWDPGSVTEVVASAGWARLDLRGAVQPGQVVRLRVAAVLGAVTVTVSPEVRVADSGLALLGVRSISGTAAGPAEPPGPAGPDAPVLVLSGPCVLGRIRVRRAAAER